MIEALIKAIITMAILFVTLFIFGGIAMTIASGNWGYAISEVLILLVVVAFMDKK